MKAHETEFNGTVYRSHTEALWAVVFHHCCPAGWSYEPQEFKLGGRVSYWPDFHLEHLDAYVEIKPAPIDPGHFTKPQELAKMGERVFVISGKPKIWVVNEDCGYRLGGFRFWKVVPKGIREAEWIHIPKAYGLAASLEMPVIRKLGPIWQDIIRINDADNAGMAGPLAKLTTGWNARTTHHGKP